MCANPKAKPEIPESAADNCLNHASQSSHTKQAASSTTINKKAKIKMKMNGLLAADDTKHNGD